MIAVAGGVVTLFLVISMLFSGGTDIGHLAGTYRTVDGDTIEITDSTFMYNIPDYQKNMISDIEQIELVDRAATSFDGYVAAYRLKSPQGEIILAVDADDKVSFGSYAYGIFYPELLEKI
ncbi:hypothetical protein L4D76_08315 [Photobacterium sagamiensis]|uniref:hypothetical protein n=1 Tax=Photobacterium sagamiensis TaxID=2910241 RepID=UPI003D106DB6